MSVKVGYKNSELGTKMDFSRSRRKLFKNLRLRIKNQKVVDAMSTVPREKFVLEKDLLRSYEDVALPIQFGQTISQPSIIALMLDALNISKFDNVLEIGTGSGYQASILDNLSDRVTTTECIDGLYEMSRTRLIDLGCFNTKVLRVGVAEWGSDENAPYDAIVVSAACPSIPLKLIEQLSEFGRLVVPVGGLSEQELMVISKSPEGICIKNIAQCLFVPLVYNSQMF